MEEWEDWDDDVILTILHPDYPSLFDKSHAEEFFHYCLKKFDRLRGIKASEDPNAQEDSEMTDLLDNEADDEEDGDEKLDVNKKVIRKKLPEPEYYREKEPDEDEDEDEDEDDEMPMAKLTVKDTKGNF